MSSLFTLKAPEGHERVGFRDPGFLNQDVGKNTKWVSWPVMISME